MSDSRPVLGEGLDALGHPPGAAVKAAGYAGVGQYMRNTSPAVVDDLHANGIDVWFIDEHTANESLSSPDQWADRARAAVHYFHGMRAPVSVASFMTADINIAPNQFGIVEAGWQAAGPILQADGFRRGFYAGEDLVDWLLDRDLIDIGWGVGASSWNHGHVSDRVALRQLAQQVTVGGTNCDLNHLYVADYGQWFANPPTPTPTPPEEDEMFPPMVKIETLDDIWLIDPVNKTKRHIDRLDEVVALLQAGGRVQEFPAGNEMHRAVNEVYTEVSPPSPTAVFPTAAEIATAVADEEARRLAH